MEFLHVPADPVKAAFTWYSWLVPKIETLIMKGNREQFGRVLDDAKWIWPMLRNARVFAIPQITYASVYTWADQFTTTEIADLPFVPGRFEDGQQVEDPDLPHTEQDTKNYVTRLVAAAKNIPSPQHLPFENTFLIYGSGISMTDEQAILRMGDQNSYYQTGIENPNLIGHLVSHNGDIVEFIIGQRPDGTGALFFHGVYQVDAGWDNAVTLNPWVVPGLIDLINSFKTLVREDAHALSSRTTWQKQQKLSFSKFGLPRRPMPPPFYRLELRHELIEDWKKERTQRFKKRASWKLDHRCDVRGHERVRVMRGELPIDPKLEKKLRQRGYRLYLENMPTNEDSTWRMLAERHEAPKTKEEWLAVKVSWVKDHIKGPVDRPYVPAIRTVPSTMEAP